MLELEVKQLIIAALQLEDLSAADIDTDAPLFGEGLGLDSIDALALRLAVQKKYGISLPADATHRKRAKSNPRFNTRNPN